MNFQERHIRQSRFRRQVRMKRLSRAQRSLSAAINAYRELTPAPRDLGVLPAAVFANGGFSEARKRHENRYSQLFALLDELQTEFEMLKANH